MKYFLVFIYIITCFGALAQTKYIYADVPDSLKENADYIVWEDKMEFKIHDIGKATETVKYAVCIKDQHSKRFNTIYVGFDKSQPVRKFKAEIYNANGELVKKLKKSDIKDISAVSGYSLFEDNRALTALFTHNKYPYTLVYEYEKDVNGLLNYPSWYFQSMPNLSVISSEFKVTIPNNLKLKYKEYNLNKSVDIQQNTKEKTYTWTDNNLKAYEPFKLAPPIEIYQPIVYLAPLRFSEGDYEGKMESWNEFGKWNWTLNKNRDKLPEETKTKIKELVKDIKSEKEKVKFVYEYMQNKTRYVSVQLGIGGYQTFPAEYVDNKGFGDCKALSNYTYSLLKELGIKSHYSLINAGRNNNDIITDFSRNQFNHVILCVPLEKDTVWLECTSQQQPFNFLGSFTNDRHALLITEEGGKLVKTPKYGKKVSTQYRNVDLKLDAKGHAKVTVHTEFSGLQYENREGWASESVKEQKDGLKETYAISGMEINNFKFTEFKDEIPSIHEDLDLTILRFASTSSKRMFIKMNVFNQSSYVPKNEERKIPFRLSYEFLDIDTVNFEIPEGYTIENQPKNYDLKTKFGEYSCKFEQNGTKVKFIRKYSSEKGIFPAEDYKAYYEFRKKIKKADKAKLVLVKST